MEHGATEKNGGKDEVQQESQTKVEGAVIGD